MRNIVLQNIYTRPNKSIPEYLEVLFLTNDGLYEVGLARIGKSLAKDINEYTKLDIVKNLSNKYGALNIIESRVTYDNDMYFLIADKFLLVLGYELNSHSSHSSQCFWLIENIHDSNKNDFAEFMELEKLDFP